MTKPIRIDWPGLLERIEAAGDDPAAFCIMCVPIGGRHLVYSIMELLRYEATYRVNDYDYSDWEYLMDIVDDTEIGIMASCDEVLNTITTAISNQSIIIQASSDACCFLESGLPAVDPPAETHPPGGSGGIPSAASLCISAQKAHDEGRDFLEDILNYAAAGGAITAGYISFAIAAYALSVPLALIATIAIAIAAIVSDLVADDALQAWDDIKTDMVCAMYRNGTASLAKAQIDATIDEADIPSPIKSLFKAMYSQEQVNKIWVYDVGDTTGYSEDWCDDCPGGVPFWLLFTFDTDSQGVSLSNAAWDNPTDSIRLSASGTGNSSCTVTLAVIRTMLGLAGTAQVAITYCQAEFFTGTPFSGSRAISLVHQVAGDTYTDADTLAAGATVTLSLSTPETYSASNPNNVQCVLVRTLGGDDMAHVDNILVSGLYIE